MHIPSRATDDAKKDIDVVIIEHKFEKVDVFGRAIPNDVIVNRVYKERVASSGIDDVDENDHERHVKSIGSLNKDQVDTVLKASNRSHKSYSDPRHILQ